MRRPRLTYLTCAVALAGAGGCVSTDLTSVPQNPHHTLQIWIREPPGSAPARTAARLVAAFTARTGVKAKAVSLYEDFETKLQQQAAVRQLPDVVINDAAQLGTMQVQGWLEQIDRAALPGAGQLAGRAWQAARGVDGRYYAVPFSAHTFALFVRADWRARLGLPVPRTWADLVRMAVAFTRDDPDGDGRANTYGLDVPGTTKRGYMAWYFSTYLLDNGADFLTQVTTGVWAPAVNSARAVQAAGWLKDMFCRYRAVNPDAIDIDTPRAHDTFERGLAGMYLTGPYMLPRFVKSMGGDRIEIFPVPPGPSGGPGALAEGENVYLTAGSANRAGQLAFAEFATSAEGQTIGMDGDGDGPIVRLPVNTTVSMARVRQDTRWATFQRVYDTASEYAPNVPNWTPFRQMAADTLNGIMADCRSDVRQRLDQLAAEYRAELASQHAATGR